MKTLVVAPSYNNNGYYEFPLGLAYISGSLKNAGLDVFCLNLNHYYESLETLLKEKIIGDEIDILCTGGLSPFYPKIRRIIQTAQQIKPNIITIIGGGLISSEPEVVVKGLGCSFGVIGEGEITVVDMVKAIAKEEDLSNVNGICYFTDDGKFVTTSPRQAIADIDTIPYPDYEGLEMATYLERQCANDNYYLYTNDNPRSFPLISSRSCPLKCTFCYHPIGQTYRKRSLDNVFAEIDFILQKYEIRTLALFDELFSDNKKRLAQFCERIKPYGLKWIAQLRVPNIDREIIGLLKESGCISISFGLESASRRVLESMKKGISIAQIEEALDATYNAKVGIQGNFIFLDPAETAQTSADTLKWWLDHPQYQVNLSHIEFYPGTPLWHEALSRGAISDKTKFIQAGSAQIVNITQMKDQDVSLTLHVIELFKEQYAISMPVPEVLNLERDGIGSDKQVLFALTLRCPHCRDTHRYGRIHDNGIHWYGAVMATSCRSCNQRMLLPLHVNRDYINTRIDHILGEAGSGKIGIVSDPEGLKGLFHTRTLLALTNLSAGNVSAVFLNNPFDQELFVDKIPALDLYNDLLMSANDLDVLIVYSARQTENIGWRLRALEMAGTKVFSIYDKVLRPYKNRPEPETDSGFNLYEHIGKIKKVAIFGAGLAAEKMSVAVHEADWEVSCFVDNNKNKWGTKLNGCKIKSPKTLLDRDFDFIIVASAPGKSEIFNQLDDYGFEYGRDYLFFQDPALAVLSRKKTITTIATSPYGPLFGLQNGSRTFLQA